MKISFNNLYFDKRNGLQKAGDVALEIVQNARRNMIKVDDKSVLRATLERNAESMSPKEYIEARNYLSRLEQDYFEKGIIE